MKGFSMKECQQQQWHREKHAPESKKNRSAKTYYTIYLFFIKRMKKDKESKWKDLMRIMKKKEQLSMVPTQQCSTTWNVGVLDGCVRNGNR